MGSFELLSYFWSLNAILVVQIENFDFGGLSHPPNTSLLVAMVLGGLWSMDHRMEDSLMETILLNILLRLYCLIPVCALVALALFVFREQQRRANWKMKKAR